MNTTRAGNTAKTIMEELEKLAEQRGVIDWNTWMIGAVKLCALLQNEEDKLAEMEHTLIKEKADYIAMGKNVSAAKLIVESSNLYLDVMKQRAFVKRCDETIKLAKRFASLSRDAEYNQSYANS